MQRTTWLSPALAGLLVAALALAGAAAFGGSAPAEARALDQLFSYPPPAPSADAKKPEEKKDKDKPFDEVVKDMEKIEGLFTFYRDKEENKVLIEIPPDQFDKDYILSTKVEQATGERGLYGTIMDNELVFQWRRLGKRVQLVDKNIRFRAAAGSPAARAVEKSFSDSLIGSAKLQSLPHPERKSVLVDLAEVLLSSDVHGYAPILKQLYKGAFRFDKDNSGFVMVKSFPRNAELGAVLQYQAAELERGSVTIPDPRSLSIRYRYSLVALPENDYRPRLADDRVGYFLDMYMDFTSDEPETPYVRYITRWNLKKKDPNAAVSEPVEPIVFWLENSIPREYRDAMREGILMWNAAFEKAGFKNAMVVKEQPEDADWDPADIRYNTIRWFVGYDASFAIGPSHTNPYTGQIIDADIGFSEAILRGVRRNYQRFVHPVQGIQQLIGDPGDAAGPEASGLGRRDPRYLCTLGEGLTQLSAMAYDVLLTRPDWSPEKEKEFLRQFLAHVTAHEVGHTLGLRHNFRGSQINSFDQLFDTKRTHGVGQVNSVMEYAPPVIATRAQKQGDYYSRITGTYDHWAIEYGYKPLPAAKSPEQELPELRELAARVADPMLAYATDEDAGFGPRSMDPRNNHWDNSSDPLAYYSHQMRLVQELWANMEKKLLVPGDAYNILRLSFNHTWTPYALGGMTAQKFIGGLEHNRDHYGDPNGRQPYVPVPAAQQREALAFLGEKVWAPDTFKVPADLLNKLQFERQSDFEFSVWTSPRLDYPLHDQVLAVQSAPFNSLYHPVKLARVQDLEMRCANSDDRFTLADLFVGIRQAVWAELDSGANSNSFRRNLQREHLGRLIQILLRPEDGTPEDAVTLARADLVELQGKITRALSGSTSLTTGGGPEASGLDLTNRAHLEETRARIQQALDAQVTRGL